VPEKTLTVREQYSLVPSNISVIKVARRLRWTPERAVIRIQRALPAVMEQQIYLAIASDFGILPESMAKLMRLYLGYQELRLEDLNPHSVGENLRSSKFSTFAEYLRECLNLLKIVSKEYSEFSITIEHAGMIVLHYGTDRPELLIEMVDVNLEEICEAFGIDNGQSYNRRMRTCVWLMVKVVIPENRKNGCPDILDINDFLAMPSVKRNQLRRLFQQEIPDYLSLDTDEMRHHDALNLLKREGII